LAARFFAWRAIHPRVPFGAAFDDI